MNEGLEEVKRHFEVLAEDLRSDIKLLAEGIAGVNERLDRELGGIRGEMSEFRQEILEFRHEMALFRKEVRAEFDEVKAMIKFSHAELDRRLTIVESELTDLRGRVERLESRQ